jgi:hypothetical protein
MLTYKCLGEFNILDFEELNNSRCTPYEAGEIEPSFSNTNLLNSRFFFKVTVKNETGTFTKWAYTYYFMNLQINFNIKP